MFVILYYDVNVKRVSKMLKVCRKYLTWVQNSVFEGEISYSNLERLKSEIRKIVKDEDSVVLYVFNQMLYSEREVLGKDKKEETKFL
ncbi:CRISPR-associated protein Cas2 [Thermosipho africanus Ob7]|uniref:CRISPR-associated endonuclease Cas2 n=1 Tax=Thermosipho africanus TaxID=2421 RepID=UPI000E0A4940|nr:CRISPR-associated endonuclease Cas2 [Thermosipho africanus]RDI90473.1 CRISPR-associated protein Cas2 [Thermosipho africanus Ob7]